MQKQHDICLKLFNEALLENYEDNIHLLSLVELKNNNDFLVFNEDTRNIFDAVIDILVYAIGASYKIQDLGQQNLLDLVKTTQEKQIINRVNDWNKTRNLTVFNLRREIAFLIEEIYESIYTPHKQSHDVSLKLFDQYFLNFLDHYQTQFEKDQAFFILIYKKFLHLGLEMAKLFEKQDFFYYFNQVMNANDLKGKKMDSSGKVIKDNNFAAPEQEFVLINK